MYPVFSLLCTIGFYSLYDGNLLLYVYMQTRNHYFVIASFVEMYSNKCGIKTKCAILQINTYIILNQDAYITSFSPV